MSFEVDSDAVIQELRVSAPLINDQLENQAGKYAYYGKLSSEAARRARDAKLQAQVVEAQIFTATREYFTSQGTRTSNDVINALVQQDPRRIQAWQDYNRVQEEADYLDTLRISFFQRKDLLVSIAANLRAEMVPANRLLSTERQQHQQPQAPSSDEGSVGTRLSSQMELYRKNNETSQ